MLPQRAQMIIRLNIGGAEHLANQGLAQGTYTTRASNQYSASQVKRFLANHWLVC